MEPIILALASNERYFPGLYCAVASALSHLDAARKVVLYLPSYCSFRTCDIWKSFIAQRCLWELGYGITFHAPEVFQDRNPHDLDRDFAEEVPGYTRNKEIADVLWRLQLKSGETQIGDNLRRCYEALVAATIFPPAELELVELWLENFRLAGNKQGSVRQEHV
jgi:STELLO glycosyltransferases